MIAKHADHPQDGIDGARNQGDREKQKSDPTELIGLPELVAFEVDHASSGSEMRTSRGFLSELVLS
jgi:hypothetical protein